MDGSISPNWKTTGGTFCYRKLDGVNCTGRAQFFSLTPPCGLFDLILGWFLCHYFASRQPAFVMYAGGTRKKRRNIGYRLKRRAPTWLDQFIVSCVLLTFVRKVKTGIRLISLSLSQGKRGGGGWGGGMRGGRSERGWGGVVIAGGILHASSKINVPHFLTGHIVTDHKK